MASKSIARALGLALLVAGLGLVYWGHQLSGSLTAQISQQFKGALPDQVMYRYIGGGACAVAGLFLLVKK